MAVFTSLVMVMLCCGLDTSTASVRYQWTTPQFVFPNESVRQNMINSSRYIPGNSFMLDVDVWNRGQRRTVFVSTPRFLPGTPATLSTLSLTQGQSVYQSSPLLQPYPDWSWNYEGNCDGITSVFRMQVDACDRLWVIDSGVVDVFAEFRSICPPQILVFNLLDNSLIDRYRIPQNNLRNGSLLITIAVDVGYSCRDTFAYIADATGLGIIVYDFKRRRSWRATGSFFGPSASAENFTISGESFVLPDGVIGLALGPQLKRDRTLYFHSLASYRESWVQTSVLRNPSLFVNGTNRAAELFYESPGTRSSQTAATAMNKNSVLFFNLLSNNSLGCWNSRLPYTAANLVELVQDEEALQFVSGMKVIQDWYGRETIWALSCSFQRLITGSFNASEVNFRVLTFPVDDLVSGTSCDYWDYYYYY